MRARFGWRCAFALSAALAAAPAAAESRLGPSDPRELEAFLDGLLPGLLRTHHAPGAVVSVVRDGRLLVERGYGWADLAARRPMDPERTRMRVASVSKLVTATAAMQLVAAGKLDLHADVDRALDGFRVGDAFGEPVTLHHLLTHTAGFDDRFLRSSRALGSALPPLGDYLAARMPPRVMPPGRVVSYSNHGLALVGHLVEQASGLSFPEYARRNVFAPLAMERSRFFLRVPLDPELAVSYRWQDGQHVPMGYDHTLLGPAAELNTTARDMANFMIAHLAEGRFGEAQLLPPETARRMQTRQFSVHPDVAGWGYGFQESFLNGHRAVGHGGDWRGFKSRLLLFPQHGFGIFASVNGDVDDLAFWGAFESAFAARYLPGAAPPAPAPPPDFLRAAGRYTGVYVPNRRMRSDLLKLGALVTHARVRADAGGLTLAAGDFAFRLVPTAPDLFRVEALGENAYFFAEPDNGVEHLVIGPFLTLDKAAGWANPRLHAALGLAAAALFAGTLAGWGLGLAARRLAGAAPSPVTPLARGVGAGAAALLLGGLAGVASQLEPERIFDVMIELPAVLVAALVALHLAVPLVLASAWLAVSRAAVPAAQAPLARLHYAALAGAGLLTLAQALTWNLLGPAAFR